MECNSGSEGGASRANEGRAGAPYRCPGTLIMPVGKRHRLRGSMSRLPPFPPRGTIVPVHPFPLSAIYSRHR